MPQSELDPIEILREQAELPPATAGVPEYGLGTDGTPVTARVPLRVKLGGPTAAVGPEPTLEGIVNDIVLASKHLTDAEWLLFRGRVGRLLGFLPVIREDDDHE